MVVLEHIYNFMLFSIYFLIHNSFRIFEIIKISLKKIIKSINYTTNAKFTDLDQVTQFSKNLSKVPQHLAISLTLDHNGYKEVDIKALAKLLSWAWAAQIRVASLYDHPGSTINNTPYYFVYGRVNSCNLMSY